MQQFFVEPSAVKDNRIFMSGPDVNHIRNVLRIRPGEELRVCDGKGNSWLCCVNDYEGDSAVLDILKKLDKDAELPSKIWLFQGLPKGDKMELIVQKSVELGAWRIVPFAAKRSVVRLDEKKGSKKQARWQLIAKGAAEQSGREVIPEVFSPVSFADALELSEQLDVVLIPYELEEGMEETARIIDRIEPGQSVGIFIGPEGGFEEEEVARARKAGALPVTLGKRILRTETAGIAMQSILMYHLESKTHNLIVRKE